MHTDAANLLALLTSLRAALGSSKIISGAVTDLPWIGSNGSPLSLGPTRRSGTCAGHPHSPRTAPRPRSRTAKFPVAKLLLGLPLYGYVLDSTKTLLAGSFTDPDAAGGGRASARCKQAPCARAGASASGCAGGGDGEPPELVGATDALSSIVASGALVKQSDGTYRVGVGFTMGWGNCSYAPFLYNKAQSTVVSYDDTYSLTDKAAFAKSKAMAGCFTWSLDQDDGVTLQNTIRAALGK
ncbi:hypothetical protein B0H10DRAFT_2207205 [Mycena sp. CBHHK59/15]|nr:hypothetical protein B0H10DRAFT_2207205 [Mycena sp. CBHHK59/15]